MYIYTLVRYFNLIRVKVFLCRLIFIQKSVEKKDFIFNDSFHLTNIRLILLLYSKHSHAV